MAKAINFRVASKFLLNAINKAPDKKKEKVFKDKFKIYKSRMQTNADNFFRTKNQAKNFMNTIDTIETKIDKWLSQGKFDQKELQRQVSGLISRSRNFQKQVDVIDKDREVLKEAPDNARWKYIITHAVKTGIHSDECANDLANQPTNGYTNDEMDEILSRKPVHVNCTCHGQRMKNAPIAQTSKRFEQGNF